MLSRREWIAGLASASALSAAAPKLKFGFTSYQWGSEWDIPTFIANCTKAKAYGVELRTSAKYAHGVELETPAERRREVKRMFADSPVKLISIASAERFDSPDPAKLKEAIERAKAHVLLAKDVGATGIRVFPNDFHPEVPPETTLSQIAKAVDELGKFAAGYGQRIRLENHGKAGRLVDLAKLMAQVESKNVGIKLNGDPRDSEGGKFPENFALVKDRLADTLHFRLSENDKFPYQVQWDLLKEANWDGWCFVEESVKVPDRLQALIAERQQWERMTGVPVK